MVKKASLHPAVHPSSFKPFDKDAIKEIPAKSSGKVLKDPTMQKFGEFMSSDDFLHILHTQNVNVYAGKTVHSNLNKDLCAAAAKNGIKCGLVIVKYNNLKTARTFNAMKVKGEGLVFLDIENDGAYDENTFTGKVQRTTQYAMFKFPKNPHYVARSGNKRNIASITIKW